LPTKWQDKKLGDVIQLQRGFDLPIQDRKPGRVPVVSSSGITGTHSEAMVSSPGVVTGRYGTVGNVFYIEQDYWPLNTTLFVRDFKKNDPRFVSYFLRTVDFLSCSDKSSVPGVNRNDLHRMRVRVPPFSEQRAIAHILGTLDDKIELNRRMNETVEAMARAIFKSWFVDFDPVRAKMEGRQPSGMDAETAALFPDAFQDSPLGKIPKGWVVKRLGNLVDSIVERVDATPAKDEERYIALDDMPSRRIDLSTWRPGSEVNSSIVRFRRGDVLFGAMRPYFHKVGLAQFPGITRTTTFVLRPKRDELRHFALWHFSSDEVVDHATTASVGTTIPYVRWDALANYEIPLPPGRILASFEQAATPITESIALNGRQSRTLAAIRDALLPKLISGEIRVRDGEKFAGDKI